MPSWMRRTLLIALAVLAGFYAHRPLLGVGFLGDDARTLVELEEAQREEGDAALWRVDSLHGRPLAAWSLSLSRAMHQQGGRYTPGDAGRIRIAGLALLITAALGLRVVVRRGLAPWTGEEHGRAAGFTAAVLLLVHPLSSPSAAHLGDRGDMLALAFGMWAIAVYLYFRQARSRAGLTLAWLLTLCAAASSPMAYGLPVVLAVLELASADRHRRLGRRVRTAATSALVFTLPVLLERVVRAFAGGEASHVPSVDRSPFALFGVAAEKLGVFVLPVNTTGIGIFGYLLAVLAVLAVLHPAFVAARAAPRLWGRILGAWAACIAALLALTWSVRSAPAELGDARALLAGAAVMAAGLGVASTALSGARRTLLPGLAIAVYAPLAAGNAATIAEAASRVGELHAALIAEGERTEWQRVVLCLDPPRKVAGVTALRPEDEFALVAAPFRPNPAPPLEVYGVPKGALRFVAESPVFAGWRARGLTVLGPPHEGGTHQGQRHAYDLPRVAVPTQPPSLAAVGLDAVELPLDPWSFRALTARPSAEPSRSAGAPQLRFKGTAPGAADGVVTGAWVREELGWRAVFDLERSLAWNFAGSVEALWLPGALAQPEEAQLWSRIPALVDVGAAHIGAPALRPRVVDRDWWFDLGSALSTRALDESEWVLALWDPSARTYRELPLELEGGRLRASRAAASRRGKGLPLVWSLERRVDGVTIAAARGEF